MSDWTNKQLGAVASTFAGGTPNRSVQDFFGGNIPWVKSTEVNRPFVDSTEESITEKGFRASSAKWAPKGASLVAMYGATAGQISCLKIMATTNQAVLAVVANDGLFNDYLFHYLVNSRDRLIYLAQGSGQPNLSKSIVDSLTVSFPSYGAQRKIAEILSTVDSLIEKNQALIDKYQSIKQGMMHDLFTRGIDENGQLRPSFEEAPHLYKESELGWIPKGWEALRLTDLILRLEAGVSVNSDESADYLSDKKILKTSCLSGCKFNPHEAKKIIQDDLNRVTLSVIAETILISRMNTPNLVGENAYVDKEYPELFIPDRIWATVKSDKFKYSVKWLSYVLSSKVMRDKITGLATGTSGSMKNISKSSLLSLFIALPKIDEQKDHLNKVDLLTSHIKQNEKLVRKYLSQKSGLMQDLLTGKVWVKVDA